MVNPDYPDVDINLLDYWIQFINDKCVQMIDALTKNYWKENNSVWLSSTCVMALYMTVARCLWMCHQPLENILAIEKISTYK